MFVELIGQGRDIVRRLEQEAELSPSERDELPPSRRVPMSEATTWFGAIEKRITEHWGPDVMERYTAIENRFLAEDPADEPRRSARYFERTVGLISELQQRLDRSGT